MENLDLDINNYSLKDLERFFRATRILNAYFISKKIRALPSYGRIN